MPDADLQVLTEAVREAGALAMDLRAKGIETWNKGDGTPVTDADLAVDRLLRTRLLDARPDYGWLSEETADDKARLRHERVWIVDPIDGTRSYMSGLNDWCIATALVDAGRPVAAAIYCPPADHLYLAARDRGATLNGSRIVVSDCADIDGARILARESAFVAKRWAGQAWPRMQLDMRKSIALRLCLVAAGVFDASFALGETSDWDIAGAHLVVAEAGGIVTTLSGAVPLYNQVRTRHAGVVASGPALHRQFMDRLPQFSG
ncbi:inositol monophosphatase family protein [Rhodoligotrophos defluvii]|uniref:inositol monophosphatase family protein n=1 Tax=Rhodoligotrophos defluvii TaxID=2561934 RepID=UPI001EF0EB44|nr:3'(2'),5'-bisphosphate nucleotidase CysQ [Rhodoligotrophos defluvii]